MPPFQNSGGTTGQTLCLAGSESSFAYFLNRKVRCKKGKSRGHGTAALEELESNMFEKCSRSNDPRTSWCPSAYELSYAQRCIGKKNLDFPVPQIKVLSLIQFLYLF